MTDLMTFKVMVVDDTETNIDILVNASGAKELAHPTL